MATESTEPKKRTTRMDVFNAIKELRAVNRQASRQAIADYLGGLTLSIVDEHCGNLMKEDQLIRRVALGQYEVIDQRPDRPVWGGIVAGGLFKLEIGETVLELTLGEARNVGLLTGGLGLLMGR